MVSCNACRFAAETGVTDWPIACHRRAPISLENDDSACWPMIPPMDAAIGCGDGQTKITTDDFKAILAEIRCLK